MCYKTTSYISNTFFIDENTSLGVLNNLEQHIRWEEGKEPIGGAFKQLYRTSSAMDTKSVMAISHILNKTSPLGEIMRLGHGQRPEIGEPVFYTRYTNVAVACPVPVHQSALANAQEAEIIIENFEWTLVNDGNTSSSQSSKISFAEEPADRRSTNNIIRRLNTPGNPYANVEHPEGYVPRDVVDVLCSYKDVRRQNDHHVNRITKSYHALKTAVRSMRKRAGHKDEE